MIRVMVVAGSPVMRAGLEALVASSPALELAGSYAGLSAAEALHPDVVLATVAPDELALPANGWTPAVVLLASGPQPSFTQEAFRAGVRAVLPPHATPAGILAAVEAAAGGLAVIDAKDLEPLLDAEAPLEDAADSSGGAALTPRELEVLRLMADGDANKNIAWKLGISEHTVKFHVASVLAKLHAGSRTEAVTVGIRKGLVLL